MSAPFAGPSPFPDPSQMPALQGPGAQPPQDPNAQDPNAQPGQPPEAHDAIDLEGSIAHAIESGCDLAVAAQSPDDYMRFAQGVNYLATALAAVQPQPQPVDPAAASMINTALKTSQQHAATMIQATKDLHAARAQHAQHQVASAQQSVDQAGQPSRPGAPQPSARG